MTISSTDNRKSFAGAGTSGPFSFPYPITAKADLVVLKIDADGVPDLFVLDTDYTLSGTADTVGRYASGVNITTTVAVASGETLIAYSDPPVTQEIDLVENDPLPAEQVELGFDKLTLIARRLNERTQRSLHLADSASSAISTVLPQPQGDMVIGWDASGLSMINILLSTGTSLASLAAETGADLIGTSKSVPVVVPYLQTISQILQGLPISVFRFILGTKFAGIQAGTNTDDLITAFTDAFSVAKKIIVPHGVYHVSNKFTLGDGQSIEGDGKLSSMIIRTVAGVPTIQLPNNAEGVHIKGLTLDCNVTDTAGGIGIETVGTVGQCHIEQLRIIRNHKGVVLRCTDFSVFADSRIEQSVDNGLVLLNTATDGAVQWELRGLLSQMNGGHGVFYSSVSGMPGSIGGEWFGVNTFANNLFGVAVVGLSGCPINKIRMNGGFHGSNGFSNIYIDTYGDGHLFTGVTCELAGTATTGPTLSVAATNQGSGFESTINNGLAMFTGCLSENNSYDGWYLSGTHEVISGGIAKNNGQATFAGRRNGVNNVSGKIVIGDGFYGNTGGGTGQSWGIFGAEGANMAIGGAVLLEGNNNAAQYSATANASKIAVAASLLPNTLQVQIAPGGGVTVGGSTNTPAAGVLEVAGGLTKNGTAYTNP